MKTRILETGFIEPDLTPTIGIVFQLLMLLVIAINFENTKADERSKLPRDMLAKPPEVKSELELVLNFGYARDKNGNRKDDIPTVFYNDRLVDIAQLTPKLEQEKRQLEEVHGKDVLEKVTVLIRADSDVAGGYVQQLIQKCQDSGFSKFTLRDSSDQ